MVLDELYPTTKDAQWITLKVAPRRLKNKVNNKAIYNVKRLLGVKWPPDVSNISKKILSPIISGFFVVFNSKNEDFI